MHGETIKLAVDKVTMLHLFYVLG